MKRTLHNSAFRSVLSMVMMLVVIAAAFPLTAVTKARAESRPAPILFQNGSFEDETAGVPANWTLEGAGVNITAGGVLSGNIDLGVTMLGGCVSQDTTDYVAIAATGATPSLATFRDDHSFNPKGINSANWFNTTANVTSSMVDSVPIVAGSKVMYLNNSEYGGDEYRIIHGPAVVSEVFSATVGDEISFDWYAKYVRDNFAILGYLLDTSTCTQTEIVDETGRYVTGWQNARVTIPATSSTYRFVFVNGTFDQSGGSNSGASMYIDNISVGAPQTITMDLSSVSKNYHASFTSPPFSIASEATTTSNLTISFFSETTSVCTVSGSTVTILLNGTCTILAVQNGGVDGASKLWAAAPSVRSSFTVTNIAATAQTITFNALTEKLSTAADFTVSATTTSPLTVTFRVTPSTSSGICTVTTAGEVDVIGPGLCSIDAVQAGGASGGTTYAPATSVTRTFNVLAPTAQTITFAAITDRLSTAGTFSVSPTASSSLAVTVTSQTTSVCTISGGTVTMLIPGTCTLRATQAGGDVGFIRYTAAPNIDVSFNVQDTQTITFNTLTEKLSTAANFTVSATSDSSLAVTYRVTPSTSAGICTVTSAGEVDVIGPGVCSIDALQVGGSSGGVSYVAGTPVTRTFNVLTPTAQTITFAAITDRLSTAGTFSVSPTASSRLAVTVTSQTPSICTISSGTVTLVTDGTCTLRAAQAGADVGFVRYTAAPNVDRSFKVLATQTITFGALSAKSESDANFTVTGTASSGLPLTFSTTSPSSICTVTSAGVVDVVGPGTCAITANQSGGLDSGSGRTFGAAPAVIQSFAVNGDQTITFNPTDKVYTSPNYNLTATTDSGLPVTYTSSTPSICTVTSSGTVDLLDVGECTITATAAAGTAGGVTYGRTTLTKSFNTTPAPQTLNFPTLPEWRLYEGNEITPAGVASSGLPVTYTTTTPLVCTVVGGKITVVGVGKCTVKASVAAGTSGGVKYAASSEVQREFWITNTTPTATFTPTRTNTPTPTRTPTPIPLLLKKGAVGGSFVLGLLQNDTLVTWGMGREGQTTIPPCCGANIQDIAVGTNFALALKGGRVYGWGANTRGQLNFPTTTQSGIKAVAAGGAHGLALTTAGKVIAWGENGFMQAKVPALSKVVTSVVGGSNHTVVLFSDGTVQAWGANDSKQSSPPTTLTGITQIAAGLDHNLALKSNGTVIGWGNNAYGQSAIPRTAIDIKQVSAGTQFSMAVKKDGSVVAWGRNDYNQTVIPPVYTDIYSAFAGYANTILGLRSGRIIVLGDQNNGVAVSRTPTKTATPTP